MIHDTEEKLRELDALKLTGKRDRLYKLLLISPVRQAVGIGHGI